MDEVITNVSGWEYCKILPDSPQIGVGESSRALGLIPTDAI